MYGGQDALLYIAVCCCMLQFFKVMFASQGRRIFSENRVLHKSNSLSSLVGGFKHLDYFPFHLWDVIPTPLTNSIIFQDGHIATPNQIIIP